MAEHQGSTLWKSGLTLQVTLASVIPLFHTDSHFGQSYVSDTNLLCSHTLLYLISLKVGRYLHGYGNLALQDMFCHTQGLIDAQAQIAYD